MKKIIILIIITILLSFLSNAASLYPSTPKFNATLLSQSPDPVEPGQIVDLNFRIENIGKETTQDVIVKVLPKHPFTIYNDDTEKNIGKLRSYSTGADAYVVEFKLKVDEGAVEEETLLELEIKYDRASTINDFMIDVQTHDAVLDIATISSDPEQIASGETAEVSIMIKNLADSLLKDIRFKLDFDDADLPLAPYKSSSERILSQLQSGYQNTLVFNVIADPSATAGLYKVPMNITYNDEKGNNYYINDVIALQIGDVPKVTPYIKRSTVLQNNKEGKVTLEVANAGTTDVKFLELTILPSEDFQLVSTTNYFYIGDVDSDDTESEEIDIYVNKNIEDVLVLPVKLKYTDANNKPYQQQFDLELNLYSGSELKKFGIVKSNSTWLYFLLLILIVVGIIFYRRCKKDPQKCPKLLSWIPFLKSKK